MELSAYLPTVVLFGGLLYVQWKRERIVQTLTALAGTGALITIVSLPISGWFRGADKESGEGGLAVLMLLLLVGWSLAVVGHILRHALDLPIAGGTLVAVAYFAVSMIVIEAFFPRPA